MQVGLPRVAGQQRRLGPGAAGRYPAGPARLGVAVRPPPVPLRLADAQGPSRVIDSASFSPDGSRIVTAAGTGRSGSGTRRPERSRSTLQGHTGASCRSASFSPDGTRVVTGGRGPDGEGVGREDRDGVCSPSRGTPVAGEFGVVQSGRVSRIVTGSRRQDGQGLGREDRGRTPDPQRAHHRRHVRDRSAPTGRGS